MTIILENYRTFDHVADLNAAIRLHLKKHGYKLNKTAIKVFEVVSRHAVSHKGAAWLKLDTLAELVKKSKPTVRRALALLERLHMIERVAFMRPKTGGNGGNIIRVLPADDCPEMIAREDAEKPEPARAEASNSPKETINFKSYNNILKDTYQPAAPVHFYGKVKQFIQSTIGDDQPLISKLYGVFKAHSSVLVHTKVFSQQDIEQTALTALHTTVMASKTTKIVNIAGYFSGVLKRMTAPMPPEETVKKAPIRVESLPAWFGKEQTEKAEPEWTAAEREEIRKLKEEFRK